MSIIVVMPYIEDNRESCPRCGNKEFWLKDKGYCCNCRYIEQKKDDKKGKKVK